MTTLAERAYAAAMEADTAREAAQRREWNQQADITEAQATKLLHKALLLDISKSLDFNTVDPKQASIELDGLDFLYVRGASPDWQSNLWFLRDCPTCGKRQRGRVDNLVDLGHLLAVDSHSNEWSHIDPIPKVPEVHQVEPTWAERFTELFEELHDQMDHPHPEGSNYR